MKEFTTKEQSRELAEIFSIKSADRIGKEFEEAWSVKALLELLPKDEYRMWHMSFGHYNDDDVYVPEWYIGMIDSSHNENKIIESCGDDLIDVIYEVLLKINHGKNI